MVKRAVFHLNVVKEVKEMIEMIEMKEVKEKPCNRLEPLEPRWFLTVAPHNLQADQIHQAEAMTKYPWADGTGESIAIVDTGVDYNHSALGSGFGAGHKVVNGFDFISGTGDPLPKLLPALNLPLNHGTVLAGIAASSGYSLNGVDYQGVARGASIIACRTGSQASQVVSALNWIIAHRKQYNIVAINILGTGAPGYVSQLRTLANSGVFVNSPSYDVFNSAVPINVDPAGVSPYLYFTGAADSSGALASITQRGPYLDFLAPGQDIVGPTIDVASNTESIATLVGTYTSESSPFATGAAADLKAINPSFSPDTIADILRRSGSSVVDGTTGITYHRIDLLAALDSALHLVTSLPEQVNGPWPKFGEPIVVSPAVTIQAEDFDSGGEGIAYHTPTPTDSGPYVYRHSAVNIIVDRAAQGGYSVSNMNTNAWMAYSIHIPTDGTYQIQSQVSGYGQFHFEIIGKAKTKPIKLSSNSKWSVVNAGNMKLAVGDYVLRMIADKTTRTGLNADSISMSKTG